MPAAKTRYVRKLSAEEARERFIFVTQDSLGFFPPSGVPFPLRLGKEIFQATVEAVSCNCVGFPHQHYRIQAAELAPLLGLARGSRVVITREAANSYSIAEA